MTVQAQVDDLKYLAHLRAALDDDLEQEKEDVEDAEEFDDDDLREACSGLTHYLSFIAYEEGGSIWGWGEDPDVALREGRQYASWLLDVGQKLPAMKTAPACRLFGHLLDAVGGGIPYEFMDGVAYPVGITAEDWANYRFEPDGTYMRQRLTKGKWVWIGRPVIKRDSK